MQPCRKTRPRRARRPFVLFRVTDRPTAQTNAKWQRTLYSCLPLGFTAISFHYGYWAVSPAHRCDGMVADDQGTPSSVVCAPWIQRSNSLRSKWFLRFLLRIRPPNRTFTGHRGHPATAPLQRDNENSFFFFVRSKRSRPQIRTESRRPRHPIYYCSLRSVQRSKNSRPIAPFSPRQGVHPPIQEPTGIRCSLIRYRSVLTRLTGQPAVLPGHSYRAELVDDQGIVSTVPLHNIRKARADRQTILLPHAGAPL